MRTIYTNPDVVHLTEDGEKTLCGCNCHNWWKNGYGDAKHCPRCAVKGDFDEAFAEDRAVQVKQEQARKEQMDRNTKRNSEKRNLLRNTVEQLAEALENTGCECGIEHHVSGSTVSIEINGFKFKMTGNIW